MFWYYGTEPHVETENGQKLHQGTSQQNHPKVIIYHLTLESLCLTLNRSWRTWLSTFNKKSTKSTTCSKVNSSSSFFRTDSSNASKSSKAQTQPSTDWTRNLLILLMGLWWTRNSGITSKRKNNFDQTRLRVWGGLRWWQISSGSKATRWATVRGAAVRWADCA